MIAALPKVELHLHLDTSLSFDVVHRLDPTVTRDEFDRDFVAPAKCPNLAALLEPVGRQVALMQTEEALAIAVDDLFEQLKADGVIYAEIRFAPLLHLQRGLSPARVVEAVDAATRKAIARTGIEARLILCTLRHHTRDESLVTAALVEQYRDGLVVALDIAGDEAAYPLDNHVDAFRYVANRDIARTAHAGEARGPESVRETLAILGPSRIGHGVRSIEDHSLVESLVADGIHLEVCPSSNVRCSISHSVEDHPIGALHEFGVSLGVNTDGRTLTDITLTEEYRRLQDALGWSVADLARHNLEAIDAAFIPESLKPSLRQRIREAYRLA